MADVLTLLGAVQGCEVTAQGTPNMTVAVAVGFVIYNNSVQPVTAGNVTIAAADANLDRMDLITVNSSGTVTYVEGTISGGNHTPATSTDVILAQVWVWSQANSVYTGTITSTAIIDVRVLYTLPQPADTLAFTFLSGAQSNADPGSGNFGFDATSFGSIAHIYVSYGTPTLGGSPAARAWLQGGAQGSPILPWYLRTWSRKQPGHFIIFKVTSFTDHSTYCDLAATYVAAESSGLGPDLSTDAADTIFEFDGAVPPAAATGTLLGIRNLLNGTTSYTPTSGTNTAYVECQAGGGAVQTAAATTASGGGGGGGYSASKITTVGAGAHTVAIGAGGVAGNNKGGDTSYTKTGTDGGTAPLAKGGLAGGSPGSTGPPGAGGPSGTGTGDITADGGGGGPGIYVSGSSIGIGGQGGSSFFGSGGAGTKTTTVGTAGGLYGGGAGGGNNVGLSSAAGGNGLLRITEYT